MWKERRSQGEEEVNNKVSLDRWKKRRPHNKRYIALGGGKDDVVYDDDDEIIN